MKFFSKHPVYDSRKSFLSFCLFTATSLVSLAIFSVGFLHGIGAYLLFSYVTIDKMQLELSRDFKIGINILGTLTSSLYQSPFISFASNSASS